MLDSATSPCSWGAASGEWVNELGMYDFGAQGISTGIAQGENRKTHETVRRLLAEKCNWDFITRVTGVKEEEWKE